MTDIDTTAQNIVESLAIAFGGYSQIPNSVIGLAVFGQANNSPSPWSEDVVCRVLADSATVVDLYFDLEPGETLAGVLAGYRAAWKKMESTHAPEL